MKNSIIIHASQKIFESSDKDFPRSEPHPGISVRLFHHIGNDRPMVEIYYECPNVISPGLGSTEEYDPDTLDTLIRDKLIHISERCREQAEELLQHSERLMQIACQDQVLETPDLTQLNTSKPQYPAKPKERAETSITPTTSTTPATLTPRVPTLAPTALKPRTKAPKPEIDWSEE